MFFGNCSKRHETWCTFLVGPAGGGFGFTSPGKALCGVGNGFRSFHLHCGAKAKLLPPLLPRHQPFDEHNGHDQAALAVAAKLADSAETEEAETRMVDIVRHLLAV